MAQSPENTSSFFGEALKMDGQWHVTVLPSEGESFSCCLWQRASPSPHREGCRMARLDVLLCHLSEFFQKAYCVLVPTNQFLWMTP